MHDEHAKSETRGSRLNSALRRVVLLRETGPKSAAWHRARVATIWRLHRLIEQDGHEREAAGEDAPHADG
jgi:hypothetical protein